VVADGTAGMPYGIDSQRGTPKGSRTHNARNALLVVLGMLAVLWIIQLVNSSLHYQLNLDAGIRPRIVNDLWTIFTGPFLANRADIEGNSLPLLILGFLAAYRSLTKFLWVSIITLITSSLAFWLTGPTDSYAVGFSGVIFGYFGYVLVRGFFNHKVMDIVVGVVVMAIYFPIFTLLFPAPHLGYEAHIGGLIGGLACGWLLRDRPSEPKAVQKRNQAHAGEQAQRPVADLSAPAQPHLGPSPTPSRHERVEADLAALRKELFRDGHSDPTGQPR